MARQPLSLKARAITLLAQREHSVQELRGKLMRIAQERERQLVAVSLGAPVLAEAEGALAEEGVSSLLANEVETLLLWLQAQGYLNEQRFVESRLHARAARYGNQRIRHELSQHGLTLDPELHAQLKDSELARARSVWERKYGGERPSDSAARLKQMRFLAGRGFSAEVVRQVLAGGDD